MDLPILKEHGQTPNICYDKETRFYTQFKCQEDSVDAGSKQKSSIFVLTLEIISIFIFILFLISNYLKAKNMNKLWAQSSVSVTDYTLYYEVQPEDDKEFI
jgi:hypothetical protein